MLTYRTNAPSRRCYDFTVALADPRALLFTRHIPELSAAVRTVQRRRRFRIHGFVVLPGRLRCIWTLSEHADFTMCLAEIVAIFAARVTAGERAQDFDLLSLQRAAWSSLREARPIHGARELLERIAQLHCDPVERCLVARPALWPWSSYRREARAFRYAIAEHDGSADRYNGVHEPACTYARYSAAVRSNVA